MAAASPLCLLLPGRPVRSDFVAVSPTRFMIELPQPSSIPELGVFLQPGAVLPPSAGLVIYWALPPFESWTALGTVSAAQPSAILRTGWPSTPEVAAAPAVRLGVSLEEAGVVANLASAQDAGAFDKLGFAQLVAQDLFTFLGSFASVVPGVGERLVIPPSALQLWLTRIVGKFRQDPNFLFRARS